MSTGSSDREQGGNEERTPERSSRNASSHGQGGAPGSTATTPTERKRRRKNVDVDVAAPAGNKASPSPSPNSHFCFCFFLPVYLPRVVVFEKKEKNDP